MIFLCSISTFTLFMIENIIIYANLSLTTEFL